MSQLDALVVARLADDGAPSRAAVAAKAVVDRVGAAVLLVAILPVLLVLVAAIRVTSRGPALFTQARVGHHGQLFRIVKLRTMVDGADVAPKVPDDPRTTPLGRWLRRWSLDELPNLWNVARGEMSLVGPRPDLPGGALERVPGADLRLVVRPGLTGLWQVSGRSHVGARERLRLDVEYVERWSLGLDARILGRTIAAVLRGDGAY